METEKIYLEYEEIGKYKTYTMVLRDNLGGVQIHQDLFGGNERSSIFMRFDTLKAILEQGEAHK